MKCGVCGVTLILQNEKYNPQYFLFTELETKSDFEAKCKMAYNFLIISKLNNVVHNCLHIKSK